MNETSTGNPRTLITHQEMQMRDVQRAQLAAETPTVSRSGLHVANVVSVDRNGDVKLDVFTNMTTGEGTTFSCLNFTACRPGDTVIYTYVDETPIVLGKMPAFHSPWRVPQWGFQDTFMFDDFDTGAVTSGAIGNHKWFTGANGSGVIGFAGYVAGHPGIFYTDVNATVGSYGIIYSSTNLFWPDDLVQFGFGFLTNAVGTATAAQVLFGTTDNLTTFANATYFYNSGALWRVACNVAGVSQYDISTDFPFVDQNWYMICFQQILPKTWVLHIFNTTDGTSTVVPLPNPGFSMSGAGQVLVHRLYQNTAGVERTVYLDYAWWARRNLTR